MPGDGEPRSPVETVDYCYSCGATYEMVVAGLPEMDECACDEVDVLTTVSDY